jgi:YidC/Oxa1 family membrane protein insertase
VIDALATPVAFVLKAIHSGLSTFLIPGSGPAWGLSIVLLTVCVRILLFPLFVKQIKSQRRMQQISPLVKELQKKHKGDRETLNVEMMKLYKEHNANPISGCLPLLVQLPIFFALFSVVKEFGPGAKPKFGLSAEDLEEGGLAQVFGAPIAANFRSTVEEIARLDGNVTTVRIVAIVMIVLMGGSTFWTQRQMMARAGTVTDPQQIMVQKVLLYVLPLSFAVSGVIFPIGVLLYWLTTNFWSMGQQHWVIKKMPPVAANATTGKLVTTGGGGKGKPGDASAGPSLVKQPKSPAGGGSVATRTRRRRGVGAGAPPPRARPPPAGPRAARRRRRAAPAADARTPAHHRPGAARRTGSPHPAAHPSSHRTARSAVFTWRRSDRQRQHHPRRRLGGAARRPARAGGRHRRGLPRAAARHRRRRR